MRGNDVHSSIGAHSLLHHWNNMSLEVANLN